MISNQMIVQSNNVIRFEMVTGQFNFVKYNVLSTLYLVQCVRTTHVMPRNISTSSMTIDDKKCLTDFQVTIP